MARVVLLYHFFAPAIVVSAVHFSQLAEGLSAAGHDVEVWPANRVRYRPRRALASRTRVGRAVVRRCWRPGLSQDRSAGRLLNTLWMWLHWAGRALTARGIDVVVVGTDPPMSVVLARLFRWLRPRIRIVHWSFDLYPDAAVRHGLLAVGSPVERVLRAVAANGLRACDAVVDIGPCMRERVLALAPSAPATTIVPWAIVEAVRARPPDAALRRALYGDARAVLLYAGHLGIPHDATPFVELARRLRDEGVVVAFQRLGSREAEVRQAARDLPNVRFLPASRESGLVERLETADMHLVGLREGFEGTVVPSKFFAALAVGRPVIYAGSASSSVARWIGEFDVGTVVAPGAELATAMPAVRAALARATRDDAWSRHCWSVGREHFSRSSEVGKWCEMIDALARSPGGLGPPGAGTRGGSAGAS